MTYSVNETFIQACKVDPNDVKWARHFIVEKGLTAQVTGDTVEKGYPMTIQVGGCAPVRIAFNADGLNYDISQANKHGSFVLVHSANKATAYNDFARLAAQPVATV